MSWFVITVLLSIVAIAIVLAISKLFIDALKNKIYFLETMLKNMNDGVIAVDANKNVVLFNKRITEFYCPTLKTGISLLDLYTHCPLFKDNFNTKLNYVEHPLYLAVTGENVKGVEIIIKDNQGIKHFLTFDGQPILASNGTILGGVIMFSDISKRKTDEEELKYRATHDQLTNLPNRLLLLDRLNQAILSAKRHSLKLTVVFIDLDNFKLINDALGHTIGDTLLKMVSARFTLLLRSTDTLSRLGGDEFVIVLPDLKNINDIPNLLDRILKNISEPYKIDEHEINITCSLGFSVYPDSGEDADTLLKHADNAMYQAKATGKNTFKFYDKEMHIQVKNRLEIENDLRHALINEEFFLEYQPKMNIKTNQLVGFEALVRWKHPERGVIQPNDFISITEDTGIILPLGKWVMQTACKQNKAWQDAGFPPVSVAINVSARQFKENNLLHIIKEVLDETKLSPQYLEVELTESLAMSNPKEFIVLLAQFKQLNIKTSIDDFGTGYSSLNYLRQFSVNSIKIDQSFIKEMEIKTDNISIITAIISVGHSLNMNVIAEGVETKQQLLQLQAKGCDEMQGYYLSPPLSVEQATEFQKNYPASVGLTHSR